MYKNEDFMTIRPKIDKPKLDDIIDKGGHVYEDLINQRKEKKKVRVNVEMPPSMVESINEVLKHRVGITRNGWILEAIQEKLQRSIYT